MKPQKPGYFSGPEPKLVERKGVTKERVAQKVRSWTVQNEMRSVLGRMTAGTASRILNSANASEIRV